MPLASIITPGTLSVQRSAVAPSPTRVVNVPNLDFMTLSFAADMPATGNTDYNSGTDVYFYNGPSQAVKRIATAVAAEGAILQIDPPAANSSWELSFSGPALKCAPVDQTQYMAISRNLAMLNFHEWCNQPYGYLSWTEGAVPVAEKNATFTATSLSANNTIAKLYLATAPGMWDIATTSGHITPWTCFSRSTNRITRSNPMGDRGINSTMLKCMVYNSSYHASFEYTNGKQHISVDRDIEASAAPLRVLGSVHGPSTFAAANCSVLNRDGTACFFDESVAKSLSYQAIADAFNQLIVGSIFQIIADSQSTQQARYDTRVTSTSLLDSPELAYLRDRQHTSEENAGVFLNLQLALAQTNNEAVKGLTNAVSHTKSVPLQQALENMFQDFVISLMSSKELQPNNTSPSAPPMTSVTLPEYHNVYVYNQFKLWLAYGLAIVFSTISVLIGMTALMSNGASYSNSFSTILRTSRFAHIEPEVREQDADGRDPLPKHLQEAQVMFTATHSSGHELTIWETAAPKEPMVGSRLLGPVTEYAPRQTGPLMRNFSTPGSYEVYR